MTEMISVTIPVFNEEKNLEELYVKLVLVLDKMICPYEIIFVNDGSSDGSSEIINKLAATDAKVKAVHFARNFEQTAAMMAGFDHAAGDIIIPIDADLQNDPKDIPKLVAKILVALNTSEIETNIASGRCQCCEGQSQCIRSELIDTIRKVLACGFLNLR